MPSMDTPTRISIIDGVLGQGPDRWVEFYSIYKPMLLGYFRKQGLSEGDAQDLSQEVFLKLCRKIHTYDRSRTRFRTWLFTVARNTMFDRARQDKTQRKALAGWKQRILDAAADEEERERARFEEWHHARILQFAFEEVRRRTSDRVWKCFEASVIQGKRGAEVAEMLGVSTNVVYVNSWRVLRNVKDLCRRYDEDLKHEPDDRLP